MSGATLLGLVAGAVTSIAVIPQVVKAYRSRQVRDLSIWQPVFLVVGMVLWFAYGVMIGDLPLMAANLFSIACNGALIVMKVRFRGDDNDAGNNYLSEKTEPMEGL